MLFSRSCVAESFSTTPRAPNCKASTICFFSAAAVNRITRTGGPEFGPVLKSRSASNPCRRGIARSNNRISGFNSRASFTASAPSHASPTTFNPSSDSSSRRNPSRKMGWSSAMTMRTGCDLRLSICDGSLLGYCYLKARTSAWSRFYREFALNDSNSLLNHRRSSSLGVKLGVRQAALKRKTAPVILDHEVPFAIFRPQPHNDMTGATVLAHVHQALLDYACDLAADGLWHLQ